MKRIYPLVVFLLFVNILKESCAQKGSLTFVIDDTLSMGDDIDQVKESADRLTNIVFNEKSSVIENMVLVTINDPSSHVQLATKNRDEFKRNISALYVHNEDNPWCEEPSLQGVIMALEESLPNSYLYVFTDASATDYKRKKEVTNLCQKKQSQIVFVLTGHCYGFEREDFQVFYDIADACSGLAFFVRKNEVNKAIDTIEDAIKGSKTVIDSTTVPAGGTRDIRFTIDGQTEYAIVSAAGYNVQLSVRGPAHKQEPTMWNNNGKVIKLLEPTPGEYVANVTGETKTSVIIIGRTDFVFTHGFSVLEPKFLGDTVPQPIADTKVHLSISVTDEKQLVDITSAQILNMDNGVIGNYNKLPLRKISKDFYITEPFVAPSSMFKVAVKGKVKATGKDIKRISKIPITPQPQPPKPDSKAPIANIVEGNTVTVDYDTTVKLTCKIKAYPEPKITWSDSKGKIMKSSSALLEHPYDYISYMEISHVVKGETFTCFAVNDLKKSFYTTKIVVKSPFSVISTPKRQIDVSYGTEGTITCNIKSSKPMQIHWHYADEYSGKNKEIVNSKQFWISPDGTNLKIKKMDFDLEGKYTCKASLTHDADQKRRFDTRIKIVGVSAPKISGIPEKKVVKGSNAVIECKVSGVPKPTISWLFMADSDSNSRPLVGSTAVLHISNVEEKDAGQYACTAKNKLGSAVYFTRLTVQVPPKITTSHSTVYESTEGDHLLRIPCIATGLPKPIITWKMNGRAILSSPKYSLEDGALVVRKPKVGDTGVYTCEATNEVSSKTLAFQVNVRQAPKVTGIDVKKVRLGSLATIECTVTGVPKPTIIWQFIDNNSNVIVVPGSYNKLHITNVKNEHAGNYKCVAQNNVGKDEHVTKLIVESAAIIVTNITEVKGLIGDVAMRIPCEVIGIPKPVVTWKVNGIAITANTKYVIEEGALVVVEPNPDDSGTYKCEARNYISSDSATIQAIVDQAPKVTGIDVKKVRLGSLATIECTVKGVPKPTIIWQFIDNNSNVIVVPGSYNKLHITNVKNEHAGNYKCVAQNKVGKDEHVTKLIVESAAIIVTKITEVKGLMGDVAMRIPCEVIGNPKPVVTWKVNGIAIKANTKYVVEEGALEVVEPNPDDSGTYKCEARNYISSDSATIQAIVDQAPKVTGIDVKKVRLGSLATIECTVKGVPKPTIIWQFIDNNSNVIVVPGSYNKLHITNVKNEHAGNYKCVAQNKVGKDEHVTKLIVESAAIIVTNITEVKGLIGDVAMRIPCEVIGIPKPVVTWKLNGIAIKANTKYLVEEGALVVVEPNSDDSGTYKCEARNYISSDSATIQAIVDQDFDYGTTRQVYAELGETKKLQCEAYTSGGQSVRWFIEGVDMKVNQRFFTVERASRIQEGNYTCRVSDKHGNIQTITYEFRIGKRPQFFEKDPIENWSGVIPDILDICVYEASPDATVKWTVNGKVLVEPSAEEIDKYFTWGHYTCNVSNPLGSVQRSFDVKSLNCLVDRNLEVSKNRPLFLSDQYTWPLWESTERTHMIMPEKNFIMSCPNNKHAPNVFEKFPTLDKLNVRCIKEDTVKVNDNIYKLSDLRCTNKVSPTVIKKKNKCLTKTSELLRVGYNVEGFLETFETCFDTALNMPLYSRVLMTPFTTSQSEAYKWYKYPGIGNGKDVEVTCKDSRSLGCYMKAQLVSAEEFNYDAAKYTSFIEPLNAIPYWRSSDEVEVSWNKINEMVKSQFDYNDYIITWSGIHTIQNKNGALIPRYLWKVVSLEDEAIAFVHVNDPSPTEEDFKKCANINTRNMWYEKLPKNTYCCSLTDFLQSFDLEVTDVGEPRERALQKIEKRE